MLVLKIEYKNLRLLGGYLVVLGLACTSFLAPVGVVRAARTDLREPMYCSFGVAYIVRAG